MKTRSSRRRAQKNDNTESTNPTTSNTNDTLTAPTMNARIELFFSSPEQLCQRVQLLQSHGYYKFNLVNKNAQDTLQEWCEMIRRECPTAHICAHYSLKYNTVARQGNGAHVALLQEFIGKESLQANEVLLVSGGHNSKKPRPRWNTVEALKNMDFSTTTTTRPVLAVAYNPYIPKDNQQQEETNRLQAKLQVLQSQQQSCKIYLQFGTDLVRLKQALEWIRSEFSNSVQIAGSVFLPTKQLIAQQKFRPWNGVFLSEDFLSSPEMAQGTVVEILKLYQQHNVEPLWEAPGIRTVKDLQLVTELMRQASCDNDAPKEKVEVNPTPGDGGKDEALSGTVSSSHDNNQQTPTSIENSSVNDKVSASPASKRQKTVLSTTEDTKQTTTTTTCKSCCLLLFGSHDLRLYDNVALQEACQQYSTVIPVFLWSPLSITSGGIRAEALEVLLKEAVHNLNQELETFGLRLICRDCGTTVDDMKHEFARLLAETQATAVYYNRDFSPHGRQLESARAAVLQEDFPQVPSQACQSTLLYDIDLVSLSKGFHGGHWGTLMPFLKNCQRTYGPPRRPIPKHETFGILQQVQPPQVWPCSEPTNNLTLAVLPTNATPWHQAIKDAFPDMSYQGAHHVMDGFFDSHNSGYRRYGTERSRADKERATSRLSCHLRLGTLSPNELYWRHEDHPVDSDIFSRRLVWRDLAYYQLRCFPEMSWMPIRAHYKNTAWVTGEEADRRFEAWKWGKTGYPIVDAGMRELYKTGWMTQTVRMVVASFLVEYLRVNWVKGCEWFYYTLVDADTAINAMMWQNAGKCGIDQWNFVLSPESASQDPTGKYSKKWVPELKELPLEMLHRPWQTPSVILERYGVVLGENYPHRVVTELKAERAKSIESTLNMRRNSQEFNDSKGYDTIMLPNGEKTVVVTKKEYRIDQSGRLKPKPERRKPTASVSGGIGKRGRRGRR